jgi:nucleotide-binding universal stress UspA family protein
MSDRLKILLAYDGSDDANAAIDDLGRAGLRDDVRFKVLSVVEHWLPPPSALEIVEHIDREQEYMTLAVKAVGRLRKINPSWEAVVQISEGSPATEIIKLADGWHPDLIVVGAQGRGALGRFIFGSVSQKVLHESNCTVRVARHRVVEPDRPIRLVIGFDGSLGAKEMVRAVTARDWPTTCEAHVVYAAWPSLEYIHQPVAGKIADWMAAEELRIKKEVAKIVDDLTSAGLRSKAVIKFEEPKRLLVEEAERWKADCIFVGARGLSTLERLQLGSISSAVAARAHCSVEVVRVQPER